MKLNVFESLERKLSTESEQTDKKTANFFCMFPNMHKKKDLHECETFIQFKYLCSLFIISSC